MKKNAFTLVELLAVIVILAIILAIAIPSISSVIKSSTKQAFESDAKMVLKTIEYKLLENATFDYKTITESNIETLLNISANNYQKVSVEERNGKPYIIVIGKNKFADLTVSGDRLNVLVDDGLVLWLDAGSTKSYPGTGTTWYDLSKSASNATLVGAPTYTSENGGIFTFDGVDDYADFNAPGLGGTATVEMWCKLENSNNCKMMFGWNIYDAWVCGGLGYNNGASLQHGISTTTFDAFSPTTKYLHYVFEMRSDISILNNKIYINGVTQTLSTITGTEVPSARNFSSGNGRISSWRSSTQYLMPMSCSTFKVYNRSLSDTEIKNNYNVMRLRFGL